MEFIIWIVYFIMMLFKAIVVNLFHIESFENRTIIVYYTQAVTNVLCVYLFRRYLDMKSFRKRLHIKECLLPVLAGIGLCWGHRAFFLLFPGIGLDLYEQMGMEMITNINGLMYTSVPVIIYTTVLGPVTEEFLMRNVCFNAVLCRGHKGYAVFITALLFAISHWNAVQFISAFFMGLTIGYILLLTKDFRAAILVHISNNTWSVLQGSFMTDMYSKNPRMMDSPVLIYGLPVLGLILLGCSMGGIYYTTAKKDMRLS